MTVVWKEGATQAQEDEAQAILDVLSTAYPGHPWGVRVYDGGFFIRHLAFPKNWGMNYRGSGHAYSSSALKAQIIRMAGEWLERAGMARGRHDADQEIDYVEGVPEKDQPHQSLDDVVLKYEKSEEREEPRPQVHGD